MEAVATTVASRFIAEAMAPDEPRAPSPDDQGEQALRAQEQAQRTRAQAQDETQGRRLRARRRASGGGGARRQLLFGAGGETLGGGGAAPGTGSGMRTGSA